MPELGSTVGKLRDVITQNLRRRFAQYEGVHLTVEEYILLYRIQKEKESTILQDLVDLTGKSKSTVLHIVDSIEQKGLLLRAVNPKDHRENHLIITPEGEEVFAAHYEMEKALTRQLLRGISSRQIESFLKTIEKIKSNN